ncbi:MAG TPA: polysaccharide biosynthesis/export family protein [Pseudolabrys sp.]|nr:polysaccharide biosynthesis/export family protein [Pseudolabrys sp.]
MRGARFLVAAAVALATSGCTREAQYVEQVSPPANVPPPSGVRMDSSSPASVQQAYEQRPLPPESQKVPANNRGLLTSRSLTADYAAQPAQSSSPRRWYPTSSTNKQQFFRQPPASTPVAQPAPDNNRGPFMSRWAGIYAEQPAQQPPAPAARADSSSTAKLADDQTGSLPPESQPSSDNNRGVFASRSAPPDSAAQPAPRRQVSAASMYTSSPAKAQQAYEQPTLPQATQSISNGNRGFFTPRSAAPAPAAVGGPYVAPTYGYASASASVPAASDTAHTLDAGDKLRIVVLGQDRISNSYIVDASGRVSMPLIGAVQARGLTKQQLSEAVAARLKQGFVREPHVTVEIENYRPVFSSK